MSNRLTLGPVAVPDGANVIAVTPELLRVLGLTGAIVTLDAAGGQTENAKLIRERKGHYLLAVKGTSRRCGRRWRGRAIGRARPSSWG